MTRIAPVRLTFNPKTLWFDAVGLDLHVGDDVIVATARGSEFGTVANPLFDASEDDEKKLKAPLKPVKRLATDDDRALRDELADKAMAALPEFRRLAAETVPDMNPVSVEYLFDGDKAVFYFEAEERVDFRDLVRKLASEFHVRVDMKQIGVRDSARMVGGLGHCGQELCCRRLGGEFSPVSIRMAKEQDLSLNPAKISGTCGRLMCCLRYEYEAYKDFHSRAPKKNAKVQTPDGEGKVVDMDVPREVISIKVGDEKPVKVPLADFDPTDEGARPNTVGAEAWAAANEPPLFTTDSAFGLFAGQLTGDDQLAQPGKVRHVHADAEGSSSRQRSRRRGGSASSSNGANVDAAKDQAPSRKARRRRSTTVSAQGDVQVSKEQDPGRRSQQKNDQNADSQGKSSSRRRSRSRSSRKASGYENDQGKSVKVGRNSSALRAGRYDEGHLDEEEQRSNRRRRRSHKSSSAGADTQTD